MRNCVRDMRKMKGFMITANVMVGLLLTIALIVFMFVIIPKLLGVM